MFVKYSWSYLVFPTYVKYEFRVQLKQLHVHAAFMGRQLEWILDRSIKKQ
jgi:hypothetical protein